MNIIKKISVCAATLASFVMMPVVADAQTGRHSASLLYGVTIPVGNTGFMNTVNFTNVSAEYGFRAIPMLEAGVSVGYGCDRQKKHTDDRYDGDYVSGFSDRELLVVPIMLQLRFFPLEPERRLQPYLGLGAGVQYAKFDITGDQIDKRITSNWASLYTPQLGLRFFPARSGLIYLDARFSMQYAGNEWGIMHVSSLRNAVVSLGAGISF